MSLQVVGAFALVAALVTITPGVDTMLVLSTATRAGARRGLVTAAGTISGLYCWGVAAATGASAVLTASSTAYTGLRVIGAAYLVWLGVKALRSAVRPAAAGPVGGAPGPALPGPAPSEPAPSGPVSPGPVLSRRRAYARGLLTNLLNPKIGVFYLSLFPQFIPAHAAALPAGLALASVHAVEGLVFLALVALLAQRAGAWLRRPRVSRGLDGVCGAAFLGSGARLALSP